jgi:hypothetical protein
MVRVYTNHGGWNHLREPLVRVYTNQGGWISQ